MEFLVSETKFGSWKTKIPLDQYVLLCSSGPTTSHSKVCFRVQSVSSSDGVNFWEAHFRTIFHCRCTKMAIRKDRKWPRSLRKYFSDKKISGMSVWTVERKTSSWKAKERPWAARNFREYYRPVEERKRRFNLLLVSRLTRERDAARAALYSHRWISQNLRLFTHQMPTCVIDMARYSAENLRRVQSDKIGNFARAYAARRRYYFCNKTAHDARLLLSGSR